jgi:hypothetical protein
MKCFADGEIDAEAAKPNSKSVGDCSWDTTFTAERQQVPRANIFVCSISWWPPLVKLLTDLCPEETRACETWLYNEGDGLDAEDAKRLARRLETLAAEGAVDAYCREQNARAEALLDVVRERHPQFDIRRAGAATSDDKGWAHPDGGVMLCNGDIS